MIDFGSAPGPHGIGCVGPDFLTFFFSFFFSLAFFDLFWTLPRGPELEPNS